MGAHIVDRELRSYRQSYDEREYHVPRGVAVIGKQAFYGCHRLKAVRLPESVQEIGERAFADCISLTELRIGRHVRRIGANAFANTPWLQNRLRESDFVIVGEGVLCAAGREKWDDPGNPAPMRLPAGVRCVAPSVFEGMHMDSLVIPGGCRELGERCFLGTDIRQVQLPEGLEVIGDHAFYACSRLQAIRIPASVTAIGARAIQGGVTFATRWGEVPALGVNWEDKADEHRLLALLHETDAHTILQLFRAIRKTEYKQSLGAKLAAAFPEEPYYQSYLRRIAKLAIRQMTEHGDVSGVFQLVKLRAVSIQSIDPLLDAAHKAGQHEIYAILLEYKDQLAGFSAEEKKLLL